MDSPSAEILSRAAFAATRVNALITDLRKSDLYSIKAEWLLSDAANMIQEATEEIRLHDTLQRTNRD